jgi:hypothetical protein
MHRCQDKQDDEAYDAQNQTGAVCDGVGEFLGGDPACKGAGH